jgi:thymidylate synthase ThyX
MPFEAQYAVPFGYKIKWYIKMNLREAIHLIELRSVPQGHPSYRKIAQQMYLEIKKIHPELAKTIQYVDMNDYQIGRLDSESKKEAKKTN